MSPDAGSVADSGGLDSMPLEILEEIFSQVQGPDLVSLATSCKKFREIIFRDDTVWRLMACSAFSITTCSPYHSFRELYMSLYPFQWLQQALWMGDANQFGSLFLSRYYPKTGDLCLFSLTCTGSDPGPPFSENPLVETSNRKFEVKLVTYVKLNRSCTYNARSGMWEYHRDRGAVIGVTRVAALDPRRIQRNMSVWPPFTIPALDRARNVSRCNFEGHYIPGQSIPCPNLLRLSRFPSFNTLASSRTETFSKLSPELLTPTHECPWRGVWMGSYPTGTDFVLMHQPTKGRLEVIRLTGK